MRHRHLNHERYTLAALDDVIARGGREDWAHMRDALIADKLLLEKVYRLCQAHISDPYAQRYHLWNCYAKKNLA